MKKYIYQLKGIIFLQIIFYTVHVAVIAAFPYMQKLFFDNILVREPAYFIKLAIIYISLTAIGQIAIYISERFVWKTAIAFETSVKKDFFKLVCNMGYKKFRNKEIGEYISLQGNDLTALEQDYLTPYTDIFKSIIMIIVYGFFLFRYIDYRIALLTLLMSIITVSIPKLTAKEFSQRRNNYLNGMGKYVNKVKEFFEGYRIIDNKTKNAIVNNHEESLNNTAKLRYRYGKFKCFSNSLSGAATELVRISTFLLIGILLIKGEIKVGTAVAAIGYVECFISPIESLLYDIGAINSTKAIREKVESYLCTDANLASKLKVPFNKVIEFKNVNVHYGEFKIKNFNYTFEKGKKYALIGHSGSGKSTIINSLLGYAEIASGKITVDGEDISSIDTSNMFSTLNQMETVFHDNFINNATVFGSFDKSNIKNVLQILNCDVTGRIQEKGNCGTLSGGELKVLFLIRMLLKDTNVCIMDEPFSATDDNTTSALQKALFSLKDKTIIMVTHKLDREHLSQFDEIILMNKGNIVKKGKYEEIISTLSEKIA